MRKARLHICNDGLSVFSLFFSCSFGIFMTCTGKMEWKPTHTHTLTQTFRIKRSTSYKRSTMILQQPQRVNVKKINNKCFERGMNTINCWIWQTSWYNTTETVYGVPKELLGDVAIVCSVSTIVCWFFSLLFSASVFIHFSHSYFSMLYHSEPWMWIIYNRKKTNLYAEMSAFKCVAQIKAMNKGNGIFVIWTYRYAGRIQRSNGSFPHVNAKFICCFYFFYPIRHLNPDHVY